MRIVETNDALAVFLSELSNAPYLALDTEFLRDQTYYPKLCLIQVAAPGLEGIIDPLAPGLDLAPFYELLKRPDIVKVLHAAQRDIEIFYLQGGVLPVPLFDSQIAAMVCGFLATTTSMKLWRASWPMWRSTNRPALPIGAIARLAKDSWNIPLPISPICG